MLLDKLKVYRVILASKSPRRRELLKGMGIDFEVCASDSEERINPEWQPSDLVCRLARQKAEPVFQRHVGEGSRPLLVIGGDTIVVCGGRVLGKPEGEEDAVRMLCSLSGRTHKVYSGLCVLTDRLCLVDSDCSEVTFDNLPPEDVSYYVLHYRPLDKAGAYGVQDWIGYRGISHLEGSFYNVMGLPTHLLWRMLEVACGRDSGL